MVMDEGQWGWIYFLGSYIYVMIDFKNTTFLSGWVRAVLWVLSPLIAPIVFVVRMVRVAKRIFGD
jgi:hypothetical protein